METQASAQSAPQKLIFDKNGQNLRKSMISKFSDLVQFRLIF